MDKIDRHSETWRAVTAWAQGQRQDAIEALIADHRSEQQRGRIALLDELLGLSSPEEPPTVVGDTYT